MLCTHRNIAPHASYPPLPLAPACLNSPAADALRCIKAVDGAVWRGKPVKACFGTTKYCNAFLKGLPCNNPECLYLHDLGGWAGGRVGGWVQDGMQIGVGLVALNSAGWHGWLGTAQVRLRRARDGALLWSEVQWVGWDSL